MNLYLTKDLRGGFKDLDASKRIVTGYFAAFNMKDSDGDIIQKGAFTKTIQERGPDGAKRIRYLQDHDKFKSVGVLKVLKEDNYGLYYEGKVGTHTAGEDFLKMVQEEIISEHSFGYRVVKEQQKSDANYLQELMMFEGSGLQIDAANPFTPITGIKSKEDILALFQTLEKALKSGTYTDECFKEIIIPKYESIKSILPTFEQKATEPNAEVEGNYKSIIKSIKFS